MTAVERGRHLKTMRQKAQLTQRQVAALFDMTPAAVSEWERGHTSPEWHRLRRLDEAYGAGGSLLAMFDAPAELNRYEALASRVDRLEADYAALRAEHDELHAAVTEAANQRTMLARRRARTTTP